VRHLRSLVPLEGIRTLKVVADAGNGMAGHMVPGVLAGLPVELIPLYFELELASGQDQRVTAGTLEWARHHAPPAVSAVLGRLPAAPPGGGRVGEFIRDLDAALRA